MKDFSFPLIFTGESKNMNSSRNAGLGCWDKYRERVLTLYELSLCGCYKAGCLQEHTKREVSSVINVWDIGGCENRNVYNLVC